MKTTQIEMRPHLGGILVLVFNVAGERVGRVWATSTRRALAKAEKLFGEVRS